VPEASLHIVPCYTRGFIQTHPLKQFDISNLSQAPTFGLQIDVVLDGGA
jgi:hypothetical protein